MSEISNATDSLVLREEGRAGLLTLNNPRMLNALTHDMIKAFQSAYLKWAGTPRIYGVVVEAAPGRAFCAGGDIRGLVENIKSGFEAAEAFFRDEYQFNWMLECFTKPSVSLVNGIVMGGGVGISRYGTHRVAGENILFAMPETGIGFYPDIGGGYFLARCPGETGMYLGLTGLAVGRADAYYAGYATHCIDSAAFPQIRQAVIEGEPIDPVLDGLHRDPGESAMRARQDAIDRIFSAAAVEEILERLDRETGAHEDWAKETAALLRTRCPLSLKVAHRQIREGRNKASLKEELITEFRITCRFLRGVTMPEGVRAALIDKDRNPAWEPATLEEVSEDMVEAYFRPPESGDIELTDHWGLVE